MEEKVKTKAANNRKRDLQMVERVRERERGKASQRKEQGEDEVCTEVNSALEKLFFPLSLFSSCAFSPSVAR